jgi:hypothetical protein
MRRYASATEYLFAAQATIQDVVENQRRALKRSVDERGTAILSRSVEELTFELVEAFRLEIPELRTAEITQLPNEEIEIDISHDPRRAFFDNEPHYVKGAMIRIAIPFSGDPELFKYPASQFNSPIPGEVQDKEIVLLYTAENPDPTQVQRDFDNRLSLIQQTLSMISGPAAHWNSQLTDFARSQIEQRRDELSRNQNLRLSYPLSTTLRKAATSEEGGATSELRHDTSSGCDLFLSHAHEDKESIARPLYEALTAAGLTVWFDEAVLKMGDSLRSKIDEGLARCKYGVVILSPRFLAKQWPQIELDGLVAKETASGQKAILPIWHELDRETIMRYSPPLAGRFAGRSEQGIPMLVKMILDVLR